MRRLFWEVTEKKGIFAGGEIRGRFEGKRGKVEKKKGSGIGWVL